MRLRKFILLIVSLCLYVQAFPVLAEDCPRFAKSPILYQYRGDRCEGVLREKPVSSFNIKLLSATAYREAINSLLEYLKLSFYLPNNDKKVAITVQELEPAVLYQMNKIELKGFWHSGMNHYQWPTTTVLKELQQLSFNDLGILVRVGENESPVEEEQVAPVVFYQNKSSATPLEYAFVFETHADVELEYQIFQGETLLTTNDLGIQQGGKPFQVRWYDPLAKEGTYELIIRNSKPSKTQIYQSVKFYHQSVMK